MTAMTSGGFDGTNPIEGLSHLIDAMDVHVRQAEGAVRRSEGNRISILFVHALYALAIAPAFAALGQEGMKSPTWTVLRVIPGAPGSLAALMFAGGVVLTVATSLRNRRWEITGLLLLILWYGIVSISFGGAIILWIKDGATGPRPSFYAPLIYAHFLTVMAVHIATLRRMIRAGQAAE